MTRRVYIAGPMSRESFCRCDRPGVWDYNYPAFTRAAATLRNLGDGDCTCPNPYQPEGETHE